MAARLAARRDLNERQANSFLSVARGVRRAGSRGDSLVVSEGDATSFSGHTPIDALTIAQPGKVCGEFGEAVFLELGFGELRLVTYRSVE
jgi:hypothetical protein